MFDVVDKGRSRGFGRSWPWLRAHRRSLVLALVIGVVSTCASLAQPLVIGELIDSISQADGTATLWIALGSLFVVEAVTASVFGLIIGTTGNRLVRRVRLELTSRLMYARVADVRDTRPGDVVTRVIGDTSALRNSLVQSLATMLLSLLGALGIGVLMLSIDPWLMLCVAGCATATALLVLYLAGHLRRAALGARDLDGRFASSLSRVLGGFTTMKLSTAEEREVARLSNDVDSSYAAADRVVRVNALIGPAANSGLQLAFGVVFVVGAHRLAADELTFGEFASFLLYLFYLIAPLLASFAGFAQVQAGLAALDRIEPLARLTCEGSGSSTDPTAPASKSLTRTSCSEADSDRSSILTVSNLHFSFDPCRPVLNGLDLSIPDRAITAIVGRSGSGKSTLLHLVSRLHVLQRGEILLRNQSIGRLPLDELRRRVALVEQDVAIFDGSIEENLVYAAPDAANADVMWAVGMAGLTEWIDELPQGIATSVGDAGTAISGGQRQRIALARMFLMRPELLLLDEVTSQQDGQTEYALRQSLRAYAATASVVVVAHRLTTVLEADRIALLHDGRIRNVGTHEHLLRTDEIYAELVETRLSAPPSEDALRV